MLEASVFSSLPHSSRLEVVLNCPTICSALNPTGEIWAMFGLLYLSCSILSKQIIMNLLRVNYVNLSLRISDMKIPKLPAPLATFLLRIPLSALFLQQGLSKFPVNQQTADAFELPFIVWWFVAYGEVGSAIGLIVGGILGIIFTSGFISNLADALTRFSGVTMACVITGVIWLMKPDNLMDVVMNDYIHISLYVGGLYFALRGNSKYGF